VTPAVASVLTIGGVVAIGIISAWAIMRTKNWGLLLLWATLCLESRGADR
jgi:hypothetical protein